MRSAGGIIEKSVLLPSHHNIVHITFRLLEGAGPVRLRLRPFVHFRRLEDPVNAPLPNSYAITARGPQYEITAGPDLPTLRLVDRWSTTTRASPPMAARRANSSLRPRRSAATSPRGPTGARVISPASCARTRRLTLVASTERWHTVLALKPEEARRFELERRRRLIDMAPPSPPGPGSPATLVLAADTFIITPVGRVADLARVARRRRRFADGDRRLSLVHRLGAGHDDLARRADAFHRPGGGGAVDPARLRPLCARRADPQPVPGRRKQGPLPYRRCDAVVLPCAWPLCAGHRRQGDAAADPAGPEADRPPSSRGHAVSASGSIPKTGC